MNRNKIIDLIAEIADELKSIDMIASEIDDVWNSIPKNKKKKKIYEESIALKLHNFYTACERIFRRIANDINGGTGKSIDWHKRLLHSMTLELKGVRPPVLLKETENSLMDFLGFRHTIRNIYGFQIDSERLEILVRRFFATKVKIKKEIKIFIAFLDSMNKS